MGVFASALFELSPALAPVLAYAETRRGILASDSTVYDALLPLLTHRRIDVAAYVVSLFLENPNWPFFPPGRASSLLFALSDRNYMRFSHIVQRRGRLYQQAGQKCHVTDFDIRVANAPFLCGHSDLVVGTLLMYLISKGLTRPRIEDVTEIRAWLTQRGIVTAGQLRESMSMNPETPPH